MADTPRMTLEDYLHEAARRHPDKVAVCCGGDSVTYAHLWALVTDRARGLSARKGRAVVFRASQTIDFVVTYHAIHVARAVAVPIEATASDGQLAEVSAMLDGMTFGADIADILFTTGTTGSRKGVMVSHRAIVANGDNLIQGQGFASDLVFVITGPLNHLGSLSKLFPVVMCGATLHILEGLKDQGAFFEALGQAPGRVATFMVPAAIRMMLLLGRHQLAEMAHKVDFIETGAAPMSSSDMLLLSQTLPHTRLYNTYASTETGIVATYNYRDDCREGCVGRALPHARVRIAPDGTIVCGGDTLMSGYVGRDPQPTMAPGDEFVTADLGRLDADGMLHILGRADDMINTGGYKVAPAKVEDAAMSVAAVADCICVAGVHPVLGTVPRLLVVTRDGHALDSKALAQALARLLDPHEVPVQYEQVDEIRRTYNGKLDRKAYR